MRPAITAPDWSAGRYETVARQLVPAAAVLVAAAAPQRGETVVDVGCGSGNAALLAAELGADVTGIDPATRLLDVARQAAADLGVDAHFHAGVAEQLPLPTGSADVLMSSFGIVFARDPRAAASELARAAKPKARIALTAWVPGSGITRALTPVREATVRALTDAGIPLPSPFAWHDPVAVAELLGPHGFEVEVASHATVFTAESPDAYATADIRDHPMWQASAALLEPRGELEDVIAKTKTALAELNEDPGGFRLTTEYVVALARRR